MSIRKKSDRWKIPADARRILETEYDACKLPTGEDIQRIADQLGTTRRRVQVYFQNRRQRSTGKKADPTPVEGDKGSMYMVPECPSFASIFEGDDDVTAQPSEHTGSGTIVDTSDPFTGDEINMDDLLASLDPTLPPSPDSSVLATPLAPDSTNLLFHLTANLVYNQYWTAYFSAILAQNQTQVNTSANSSSAVSA